MKIAGARVRGRADPAMRGAVMIVSVAAAVAALQWAQAVAVPIAVAVLLAFLLAPLVGALERRRVPSSVAVVVVVALSVSSLGAVAWALGTQLASLAQELPRYRGNIAKRVDDLRGAHRGTAIESVQEIAKDVAGQMAADAEPGRKAPPLPVVVEPPSMLWRLPSLLHSVAMGGFVVVLVIFLLLRRRDTRNRLFRLAGEQRLALTTKALDEAGLRITRYLVRQSLVNSAFGALVAVSLLLIGVPYALLWGALAATMRFVPYVGSTVAALAPTLVSLAVFPGWLTPLLVLGVIVALELAIYAGIEPWLYGRGAGLSEVAILVAIAFWTWLWGPVGLVLSTPLTVCLVVLCKNVPALRPVAVLIDEETTTPPADVYYQRLVGRDAAEAEVVAHAYRAEHPPDDVIADLLLPAVRSARRDHDRGVLTDDEAGFVYESTARIAAAAAAPVEAEPAAAGEAGPLVQEPGSGTRARLVACPVRDQADEVALGLLTLMLGGARAETRVTSHHLLVSETLALIEDEKPDVVCLGAVPPGGLRATRYLVRRLRARCPDLLILVARWDDPPGVDRWRDELTELGVERVAGTLAEVRAEIGLALRGEPQPAA